MPCRPPRKNGTGVNADVAYAFTGTCADGRQPLWAHRTSDSSQNFSKESGARRYVRAGCPWRAKRIAFTQCSTLALIFIGVFHYANRSNRSVARGGSSQALRWDGTRGVLSDRGAGRTRPRRHALRERRFADVGEARSVLAACVAPRPHDPRRDGAAHAAARRSAPPRGRIRRAPFSHRLLPVLAVRAPAGAVRDDAARPSRSAGTAADLQDLQRRAG